MKTWTETELELLRRCYSDSPKGKLLELLPNHSWNAIKVKANHDLGLKRSREMKANAQGLEYWSKGEIETLKRVYPTRYTEEIMKALPKRTWSAIETKAMELKVHRKVDRRFGAIKPVKLSDGDLGYIAGIIDGEGSINIAKLKKGLVSIISISNNDRDMLTWIQSKIARGNIYKHSGRNLRLQISKNSDKIALLEAVISHLKIKHRQAELALKFLKARRKCRRFPVLGHGRISHGTYVIHHPDEEKAYEEYVAYIESKRMALIEGGLVT